MMIIIKDFSAKSLEEVNKFITILYPNTQLLILNGVNINADDITSIEVKKGPLESCLIVVTLKLEMILEVEVEVCETIVVEKYYDEVENTLEIEVSAE